MEAGRRPGRVGHPVVTHPPVAAPGRELCSNRAVCCFVEKSFQRGGANTHRRQGGVDANAFLFFLWTAIWSEVHPCDFLPSCNCPLGVASNPGTADLTQCGLLPSLAPLLFAGLSLAAMDSETMHTVEHAAFASRHTCVVCAPFPNHSSQIQVRDCMQCQGDVFSSPPPDLPNQEHQTGRARRFQGGIPQKTRGGHIMCVVMFTCADIV